MRRLKSTYCHIVIKPLLIHETMSQELLSSTPLTEFKFYPEYKNWWKPFESSIDSFFIIPVMSDLQYILDMKKWSFMLIG